MLVGFTKYMYMYWSLSEVNATRSGTHDDTYSTRYLQYTEQPPCPCICYRCPAARDSFPRIPARLLLPAQALQVSLHHTHPLSGPKWPVRLCVRQMAVCVAGRASLTTGTTHHWPVYGGSDGHCSTTYAPILGIWYSV